MNGANSIWYQLGLDNSQLQRDASRASNLIRGVGDTVDSEGARIDNIVKRLTSGVADLGASFSAGALIKQIASVRGEFQQLEIAFETMLGSKGRADALMSQLVDTAAKTPFDLTGVANGAKQLLAYGTAAEEVNDTLIRLGNIASGLSIPLNDLVYLYGTTQVQGRLFTQDVRQFMGRGIPLVQQLAKELGKTEEQINEMVTAGKIGFPEVQKVIQNLTNEGGMFFNLMEKQSASITGQIANLEDAWDMMLNDIGSKSEGIFSGAIGVATSLIENYEKVGKILLGVVAVYGVYKGAVIALSIVENLRYQATLAQMAGLTKMQAITDVLRAKTKALNATMLANPYVLATMAIVALGYAVWALHDATTAQEKAQERLNQITEEARQKKEDLENQTSKLTGVINSETKTIFDQISAYKELQGLYPGLLKNMDLQKFKSMSATEQQKLLNRAINDASEVDMEDRIKNQESIIKNLEKEIQFTSESMSYQREGSMYNAYRLGQLDKQKKAEEIVLGTLKEQQAEQEAIRKEAEFLALPEDKRREILQNQLTELEKQKSLIESQITSVGGVLGEWQKFNPLFHILNGQLGEILNKIDETKNKLTTNPTIQNKSYWEKQKKDATEALETMTPSDKNSEAWKKQVALINEANKNLKTWDFSSKSNSGASATQKILEAKRKLDEADKQRQIDKLAFDNEMRQREIDNMDESFAKELAQLKLNFDKEQQAIEEYRKKMSKSQYEEAKNQYISKKGNDKGFEAYFSNLTDQQLSSIMPEGLRPEDIEKQVTALTKAANDTRVNGLQNVNKQIAVLFREQNLMFASNLDKELADLDTYYAEQIKKAEGNEQLITLLKQNHLRARQEAAIKNQLSEIDFKEQLDSERLAGLESIGMTELVEEKKLEITKRYIQLRIDALKKLADQGDEDAKKQVVILQQSLKKLDTQKPVQSLKSLADDAIFNAIKKGFQKAGDSAEEAEEKTTNLLGSITQKAELIASITSELQSMFGGLDESLDMAMETVGNIASGFAQRGIVGGAIATVGESVKLFAKASEAEKRHQAALKEITQGKLDLQRQYNLLLLEQNLLLKEATSIFGEKEIYKAANAIQVYRDAVQQYKDELRGKSPNYAYGERLEKLASSNNSLWPSVYKIQLVEFKKQAKAYEQGIGALYNAQIVTGHKKTGLFGWGKGKDTYSRVLDVYPDLIDKENKLNKERAQSILDTQKMSDETRKLIEQLIALQDQADAALEQLRDYLQQTFGALGTGAIDTIVDSIKNGTEAWVEFGKVGASVLEKLGEQIAYELFFADKFKKLQSDLEKVYGSGKSSEQIAKDAMNLVSDFYQNIGSNMDSAQQWMQNWKEQAEKQGFDLWKPDTNNTQSSSSRGFETMTQDQAGELNGRFTALQMSGVNIERYTLLMSSDIRGIYDIQVDTNRIIRTFGVSFEEIRNIQLQSMYYLEDINKNTKQLYQINDRLGAIEQNTSRL